MNVSRRNRLTALTRGAAVVGMGLASAACAKTGSDGPPTTINAPPTMNATATPPTINSPPVVIDAGAVSDMPGDTPASADGGMPIRRFPIPNALRPRVPADGG